MEEMKIRIKNEELNEEFYSPVVGREIERRKFFWKIGGQ